LVNNEELDLIEISHKLWSKKFFLMFCVLIPAIIALIISLFIPKRYTASATVLAPEVAAGGGVIQTPFGGFSTSGLGKSTISSQAVIAILKSDRMLEDVIDNFNLIEVLRLEKKRAAVEFLRDEMSSIELLADEGTINISVWSHSPEMSKEIVEFYLTNLEELNQNFKLTMIYPIVTVLSPPFVPEKKSFPKIKINMAIAGLGGLICGLLFIYFKEKTAKIR
jgi:tyrosine-protein kinase Etk/Wzc